MARRLGYGGLGNTNGLRDFTGKAGPAAPVARKLGYGGVANTRGARDFSGKAGAGPALLERVLGYGGVANTRSRTFAGKTPSVGGAYVPKPMIPVGNWLGF